MTVFAVVSCVGMVTGHKSLIGLYTTKKKAEAVKKRLINRNQLFPWSYSIIELETDKTLDIVYAEW